MLKQKMWIYSEQLAGESRISDIKKPAAAGFSSG
jgi:hypothetical protein